MTTYEVAERIFFDPKLATGRVDRMRSSSPSAAVSVQHGATNANRCSDLDSGNDLEPEFRAQPKRKQLRRVVRTKSDAREYLPDMYRQKITGNQPDADVLAPLYDVRSPRFTKTQSTTTKRKSSKLYGSQPALGARTMRKAPRVSSEMDSMCSSSLPVGMNMVGGEGREAKRRSSSLVLPNIKQFKFDDNLLAEEFDDEEAAMNDDVKDDDEFADEKRYAEKEVKENWLLEAEMKLRMKKFQKNKTELTIRVPDEDPMVSIARRLEEITQMAKPRRDERYVLDRIEPEHKERILKYSELPIEHLRKRKRKHWKLKDRFRHAAYLVALLLRCFRDTKIYYVDKTDAGNLRKRLERVTETSHSSGYSRSSLAAELQLCLSTPSYLRDNKMIKRILWLLRATKAYKGLFPAEMEPEVARFVSYEKYDDGRIIAYQGRTPDRFYYVIAGRVAILRQYKLSTGQVTKSMGFLTKGMTTDAEEMDRQWMREDSLVCRGQVEVLILEKKAFSFLQHTTQGPPVDFLRSLDLFEDFPVEEFLTHSDAIEYKYYGHGKPIVKDSNRTPWLLVVKSGQVKVVRHQSVIDAHTSNESKFTSPRIEELGCGKSSSHADAMLGVQAKQKKIKEGLRLPQVSTNESPPTNPHFRTIEVQTPVIYRNRRSAKSSHSSHKLETVTEQVTTDDEKVIEDNVEKSSQVQQTSEPKDNESAVTSRKSSTSSSKESKKTRLPSINNVSDEEAGPCEEEDYEPHALWLTRERTEADPTLPPLGPGAQGIFTPRQHKEVQRRRAYLQLDVLNPGDVFGLDHLQPALASEGRGFSLMSDGAEVIMINKRFFLQHAGNNTMLKVDTMYKEYISEDEATSALYEQETWSQYKSALWKRMIAPYPAAR